MNFQLEVYQQVWQRLNKSKIITPSPMILQPIPLHIFDCLTSTNTKIWELIDGGMETPMAAIALKQTAGKGQWGRNWISPIGGLYLSLALALDLEINLYPHLVMATVWGIAKVLRYYQLPVTIKWSNDLILEQRKLGGIKLETRSNNHKLTQGVVGVGINWSNAVPEMGINLQSYYQGKTAPAIASWEELTAITSYGIILGYQYYLTEGIEALLAQYLTILNSLGKSITINNSQGKVTGVTIDGKLKVKLRSPGATTEIAIAPGQISLGY